MAIYRCNQCGLVCEEPTLPNPPTSTCARCAAAVRVQPTVPFIESLFKILTALRQELQQLKSRPTQTNAAAQPPTALPPSNAPVATSTHTAALPPPTNPLQHWFSQQGICIQLDPSLSDTSGFFDDTAIQLGEHYALFGELIERICHAYRKSHTTVTLELGQLAQKDVQAITALCRNLYAHTFVARYHYQKHEKMARLTLQSAVAIRQFFEGGWLEWYALVAVQDASAPQPLGASARGVKVVFPNEDVHELDVMCLLPNGSPLCIECKSGEFRRDIDKYLRLRKRLNLARERFVVLCPALSDEQASGLSAMYEISFVNLAMFKPHVRNLL